MNSANSGTDEIAELARDFNAMADDLDSLYTNLELRVEERTTELERVNGELQEKQGELEQAFSKLQDETEYKDRLFASLSHDLRTPLASIIAYTQLAETKASECTADKDTNACRNQDTLRNIAEQARTLVGMVDNILALPLKTPAWASRRKSSSGYSNPTLDTAWGEEYQGEVTSLAVYARRIRKKIENDPSQPEHLITCWGSGYLWRA